MSTAKAQDTTPTTALSQLVAEWQQRAKSLRMMGLLKEADALERCAEELAQRITESSSTPVDVGQLHDICNSVGAPQTGADGQLHSIETRVLMMSLMLRGRVDTAAVITPLVESAKAGNGQQTSVKHESNDY